MNTREFGTDYEKEYKELLIKMEEMENSMEQLRSRHKSELKNREEHIEHFKSRMDQLVVENRELSVYRRVYDDLFSRKG